MCAVIKKAKVFDLVLRTGQRFSSRHFILFSRESATSSQGVAVSRKIGGTAKRNFAKRRMREIVRINRKELPLQRQLVLLAKGGVERERFGLLESEAIGLFKQAAGKQNR